MPRSVPSSLPRARWAVFGLAFLVSGCEVFSFPSLFDSRATGRSVLTLLDTDRRQLSIGDEVQGALSASDYIGVNETYLEAWALKARAGETVSIDLSRPMAEITAELSRYPVKTRVTLNGPMIVARDIAHARLKEEAAKAGALPDYFRDHPVYYAGPAKTPEGYASGSFGPTTAGRMDSYVDLFMENGGSFISLAKGNRSLPVTEACKKHGGFYLGSIGGPAAILAQNCIKKVEVVEYEELGMEAVFRIEVENFPAFIVVDDKGNDFFKQL